MHANTVHAQDVVCKALFAAVHHRLAEADLQRSGRVPIIPLPQPAAAMLALDISGSMLARQCATCPTRYDILKQAVAIFAQLWSQAGRPNDRLGVTYFRTTVDEPLIAGERLPVLTGNTTTLIARCERAERRAGQSHGDGRRAAAFGRGVARAAGRPGRGAACHSVLGRDAERQPDGAAAPACR